MRDPLDKQTRPGDGDPDAGGGYDRPNQPWVCGNAEEGCPCPFGPTPRGQCPELAECRPVQDGDRWQCNRSPRHGGPCDEQEGCDGPTPDGQCGRVHHCTPVRSLRTQRRRVAVGAGVFLTGALLVLLGSRSGSTLVSPGPLSNAHARLIASSDTSHCANCHPGGDVTLVGHVAGALVGHPQVTQSELCLDCHQKELGNEHALLAHGLPTEALALIGSSNLVSAASATEPRGAPTIEGRDTIAHTHVRREVACAVCHQEHQGANHDLAAITNRRCQACHQERFDSFAGSHPDFGVWPYRRRTRIVFDHARHEGIHFEKANAEFTCAQCHVDGESGTVATLGYEASCAGCHDESLRRDQADGIAMLALPTLDPEALADAGQPIGAWSEAALGDFDGDLPAPMKLLLAADPKARAAIDDLGADFSFYDFDPDNPSDVTHAASVAGATRGLMMLLASRGHTEIAERLGSQSAEAATGLPASLLEQTLQEWFGDQPLAAAKPRKEEAARHPAGGWFRDPGTLSIRYAPAGHDDRVLAAWLNAAAALGNDQAELRKVALAELSRAGGCLDCHSVDKAGDGQLAINWRAFDTSVSSRPFTRFSHTPHLTQASLSDCRHCHLFTRPAITATNYSGHDPKMFISHFEPIFKGACVTCHQPKLAGDDCTQCHNYHVHGEFRIPTGNGR